MVYQIEDEKHVIVVDGGKVWLLDTGSPMSCARGGVITFAGEQHEVGESLLGFVSPESLSGYIDREVDGLIGMDILCRHTLLFKSDSGELLVDEPVAIEDMTELPVRFTQGVPIVEGVLEGKQIAFAVDTGAQLTYATEELLTQLPVVGEKEDFYPVLGKFTTQVAEASLEIAGRQMTLQTGRLPAMLGFLLAFLRIEGILGRAFLNNFDVCLLPEKRLYVMSARPQVKAPPAEKRARKSITFLRFKTFEHDRLFVEHGDLFDLENGFNGIAAFIPCGLTAFRCECRWFIEKDPPGIVMVMDENPRHRIYEDSDVEPMVFKAMRDLVSHGATRIGMNGIRTNGDSEQAIVSACERWLRMYGERYPNVTVTLVDRRNSFRHWARQPVVIDYDA